MDTNMIGNRRSSEVYSFAISIALHVIVIAGLVWVTFNSVSGRRGVVRVFISNSEVGQTSRESIKKSEPVKIKVSKKIPDPHIASIQKEDNPAVEKSETLTEVFEEEKRAEVDPSVKHVSPIEAGLNMPTNDDSRSKETVDGLVKDISGTVVDHNISDDGFYIGEFGAENGPRFVKRVQPSYPLFARRAGKEGRVVLKLSIDEEGKLMEIEVINSAGNGFDDSAVKALKSSSFRPAMMNGSPIRSRTKLPVRFVLKDL